MAFRRAPRVRETSTAPGTGSFTVNGAVQGAQSLQAILTSNGDTCWYGATNGTAWEEGYLTRISANVYARTVDSSSNSGSAVNFASGTVDIYLDLVSFVTDVLNYVEESLASASTTDLGSIKSKCIQLTGTVPPTSFGIGKNKERIIRYTGAGLTITNSATLVCPGNVDLPLATNDIFNVISDNSSTPIWRILSVTRIGKLISIGNFSRVLSTASGNQSITGVGFKPKLIQFQTGVPGGTWASMGQSDGSSNTCLEFNIANYFMQVAFAGVQRDNAGGSNLCTFTVASMDSDGFTIAWVKSGTPTATASINYTAYR